MDRGRSNRNSVAAVGEAVGKRRGRVLVAVMQAVQEETRVTWVLDDIVAGTHPPLDGAVVQGLDRGNVDRDRTT